MESVLLLLASQLESGDAAHQRAQIEPVRFGGLPGDKPHPADKLQHHFGIELIGLGALQQSFGEVGNGARIGDHDLDPFSPMNDATSVRKNARAMNASAVIVMLSSKAIAIRLLFSFSSSASTMASAYLRFPTSARLTTMELNRANTPYSAGP